MKTAHLKKWVALATIYLLDFTFIFAQGGFQLTHFTDEDGLPQNSVKFIISDNAGFIWLSTEDGLVRFDGYQFTTFSKNDLHNSSNRMQAFYRFKHELFCYSADYEPIKIEDGHASITNKPSGWLEQQIDLNVLPKGIFKNNFQDGARYLSDGSINMNYGKKAQFKELYILSQQDSLFRYDNKQFSVFYKSKLIHTFPYTTKADWRFFMLNHKLFSLENSGRVSALSPKIIKTRLKGDILQSTSFKAKKTDIKVLWNICVDNHVILYMDKSFYLATLDTTDHITTKMLFKGFDAAVENICSAYYNKQSGQLFLGSSTKGLFVLKPHLFQTITAQYGENIYGPQIEYQPNKILTTGNRSFDFSALPKISISHGANTPLDFISLAKDHPTGNFWAVRRRWLYLISAKDLHKIAQWQMPISINAIYQDKLDTLWIGTINGNLYTKSPTDTTVHHYIKFPDRITFILRAGPYDLYVGTLKGLFQVNLLSKTSHTIANLESASVRNIFKSSSNEIWVATYGDGFYLLKQSKAIALPLDREQYLRTPHYFIEDDQGFLWIPTNKGLFQVAKSDLLSYVNNINRHNEPPFYFYYDKESGFKTNEFNGGFEPTATQTSNKIWSLSSMNGLVLFNPDKMAPLLPTSGLYLDNIIIDSQQVDRKDLTALSEDFSQLRISVCTPFLGNHKNLQITYALIENGSKDTIFYPLEDKGKITLSRLTYGKYTLIVKKRNGFGVDNFSTLILSLNVRPKWYHSLWLGILLIILFPIIGILVSNIRSRYVVRKNRELKKRIEQKTIHLANRVRMQELIIRAIGHDIRTPLKYHIILSKNIKELTEKGNDLLAKKSAILNDSSQQLFQLVENFVQYLKAQNNTHIGQAKEVVLNTVLERKLAFFKDISHKNKNVLLNIDTVDVVVYSDPELLSIIIHNLIDNAIKVASDGLITTQIGINKNNKPFLTIRDCGPGLPLNILKWFNRPDELDEQSTADDRPSNCGLGLTMVRQLARLLKIEIKAHADFDHGTTFTLLFLPLKAGQPIKY